MSAPTFDLRIGVQLWWLNKYKTLGAGLTLKENFLRSQRPPKGEWSRLDPLMSLHFPELLLWDQSVSLCDTGPRPCRELVSGVVSGGTPLDISSDKPIMNVRAGSFQLQTILMRRKNPAGWPGSFLPLLPPTGYHFAHWSEWTLCFFLTLRQSTWH